ncbi:MAG: coiled coil domain-containing protein [Planctomycetaceae bacterium]|nr:MAG: coiled coil domain-containing protein [Planctomycetaceae bacterium]
MDEKKLYEQKLQAQLDEWKAEIDKLKAKADGASADAKMEFSQQIQDLELKLEDGSNRLSELSKASGEAWETLREGVESAWNSLSNAMAEAAGKFKR